METIIVRDIDLPIRSDLITLRGNTLKSDLFTDVQDDDSPTDLTGCTIDCKGKLADGTPIDLSDYLVLDLANGSYQVSIPPSVTNGDTPWPVGLGSYDITITDTLGDVETPIAGALGLKEGAHV